MPDMAWRTALIKSHMMFSKIHDMTFFVHHSVQYEYLMYS